MTTVVIIIQKSFQGEMFKITKYSTILTQKFVTTHTHSHTCTFTHYTLACTHSHSKSHTHTHMHT